MARRRGRIFLIIAGLLALLAAVGGGLAFWLTRGAVEAANAFFETAAARGPDAAYQIAAPGFRLATSQQAFVDAATRFGLADVTEEHWPSRSVTGATAELQGTLSRKDGSALPVTVHLVRNEAGAWQVFGFEMKGAGAAAAPPPMPDQATLRQLVQVTMQRLGEAIQTGNYDGVLASGSRGFRAENTSDKLKTAFQVFADHHVDLVGPSHNDPVFDAPPRIGDAGQLILKGHLPGQIQPWYFDFDYLYEDGTWTSLTVHISSKPT
jgi:hypothetical protein